MRGLPGPLATATLYVSRCHPHTAAVTVCRSMIGIQSALASEIDLIRERMTNARLESTGGAPFAVGGIGGTMVVAVAGGVGKVRAAACAQTLIDVYRVESMIICGIAGRLNPQLKIGDIVVSREVAECGGVPATASMSPDTSRLTPDDALVQVAEEACAETVGQNGFVTGTILTCARPVFGRKTRKRLRQVYLADCVEMESAAAARVCAENNVPFVVVRAISDRAGLLALLELRKNLRESSRRVQEVVLKLLSLLNPP
jgi:adenosylhomocysteine nucleosidase